MNRVPNPLIEQMVAGLQPTRPMKFRDGMLLVVFSVLATVLAVEVFAGLWRGALDGRASAFFMVANGLLLVLGLASATSVLTMATPRVGNRHEGPKWALAMAAVLPLAAVVTLVARSLWMQDLVNRDGLSCFVFAMLCSLATAAVLFAWLRRGAPVSPEAAGLHLGIAAGALGSVAHGLSCPIDDIVHLGLYHVAPVALMGLIGRFAVPRFIRW